MAIRSRPESLSSKSRKSDWSVGLACPDFPAKKKNQALPLELITGTSLLSFKTIESTRIISSGFTRSTPVFHYCYQIDKPVRLELYFLEKAVVNPTEKRA